jgi:hypothetical protein
MTFFELRKQGINSQQLLAWSASLDLLEQYAIYLITNDAQSDRITFYNCTSPWFGSHCQYIFDSPTVIHSFGDFVRATFKNRLQFRNKLLIHTCYPYLPKCNRGPTSMCLDWREICDGKVDCIGESFGLDEQQCDELEMNECGKNEYRCHNGAQCIPLEFVRDGKTSLDCLDGTDELEIDIPADHPQDNIFFSCIDIATFSCEEATCRHPRSFACGDGECHRYVIIPYHTRQCIGTGRDWNSTRAIWASFDHLPSACGKALFCALKLYDPFSDIYSAEQCLSGIHLFLADSCPGQYVSFPKHPILYGYFQFVYRTDRSIDGFEDNIIPDLVCNDPRQCLTLPNPKIKINGFDCRPNWQFFSKVIDHWMYVYPQLADFIHACSTIGNDNQCAPHPSLFHCVHSEKCISKHRLIDGISDCYYEEDEKFTDSCLLNDSQRFNCNTSNITCLSPIAIGPALPNCPGKEDLLSHIYRRSPFTRLCNIFPEIITDDLGENDESHCDWWPCNNPYTRCDNSYHCANGIDEVNCADSKCGLDEHVCHIEDSDKHMCIPLTFVYEKRLSCPRNRSDDTHICRRLFYGNHTDNDAQDISWNPKKCLSDDDICGRQVSNKIYSMYDVKVSRLRLCTGALVIEEKDKMLCLLTSNLFRPQSDFFFSSSSLGYFPSTTMTPVLSRRQIKETKEEAVPFNISLELSPYCNRGILVLEGRSYMKKCLCPPSYFGGRCQWQNERVSLTLRLQKAISSERQNTIYHIIISIIDDNRRTDGYYEEIICVPVRDCSTKFNVYLLYPTRPKNKIHNYSVHIDAFDKTTLNYHASWHLSIPFLFLPVNRLAVQLVIPVEKALPAVDCPLRCGAHGQCFQYINSSMYFCQCAEGYSGSSCNNTHQCSCPADSLCLSSSHCVCPMNKFGPRCYLQHTLCHPNNPCAHNGRCVPIDHRIAKNEFICLCTEGYMGSRCEQAAARIDIALNIAIIPSSVIVHSIITLNNTKHEQTVTFRKIPFNQHSITLFASFPFNLLFIEVSRIFYLAVVRENFIASEHILTEIQSNYYCSNITDLFNSTVLAYRSLRRLKYYQLPCRERSQLKCFFDEELMCVCDSHRYANCFEFTHGMTYNCRGDNHCENDGQCFQDNSTCPTRSMCMCQECFYGSKCQFITQGFGLSFDTIFGYHIQPSVAFSGQSIAVKVNVALTTLMLLLGFISGTLSILTFYSKQSIEVGCGLYLRASSIISLLTISMFYIKFWQLVLSQMNLITSRSLHTINCVLTDALLKVFLTSGDWLHACVAIERVSSIIKGAHFNTSGSKRLAKWVILTIVLWTTLTHIHDPIHRQLMNEDEEEEQRIWCIVRYSSSIRIFDTSINIFHFFVPFSINVISALVIIIAAARSRSTAQQDCSLKQHLRAQFEQHKHLIISPCILIILALPRLIISLIPGCMKSYRNPWLFLAGYYVSFIPPMLVFVVFVLPSKKYKENFMIAQAKLRRRFHLPERSWH